MLARSCYHTHRVGREEEGALRRVTLDAFANQEPLGIRANPAGSAVQEAVHRRQLWTGQREVPEAWYFRYVAACLCFYSGERSCGGE